MGLGHVAMAAVSAEAARTRMGPFVLNAQAPDEGNMHTLLHWATDEQKEQYLRPLCEGVHRSCFAMTEPEVAGSDPTLIQTTAVPRRRRVGDQRPQVVHLRGPRAPSSPSSSPAPRTTPTCPRRANTAFLVGPCPPTAGRSCATSRPCRAATTTARSASPTCGSTATNMLGGRGQGHLLGQYRLGPARLAHCMRWIGQAENALEMMIDRSLNRYAHGSLLAEKQGDPVDDRRVGHGAVPGQAHGAARRLPDRRTGWSSRPRSSMAKHFVANTLWRIIDRAIQVHGALGYSHRHAAGATCSSRPAGPASPTAPTRSTDAHRPAPAPRTRRPAPPGRHRQPAGQQTCPCPCPCPCPIQARTRVGQGHGHVRWSCDRHRPTLRSRP